MAAGNTVSPSNFETRTIRKLQRHIIPIISVLYIIAFLDRINIGFAALTMNSDLAISSAQFGLLLGIFFWGYFIFEIPSNLLLHKIGARIWIARVLISWGIMAALSGFVRSVPQLYVLRFLLGVAEAGFFPGVILYLTYWFRQREQAQAIALFVMAIPVASIVGAPFSGLILDHARWLGLSSWRWLLILEGVPAIVAGVLTYFLLPSRPAEAAFLTDSEKEWIAAELAREELRKISEQKISALQALTHRRVWHLAGILFTFDVGLYSLAWMPQAVKLLSHGSSNALLGAQIMIPHLVGLWVMILVSRSSDRTLERRYHSAIPLLVAAAGMMFLGATSSPWISIVLWSFAALGIYGFTGPFFALPSEFLTGYSAASGIALMNSIGNLGGFAGSSVIGHFANGPMGLNGALALVGISLFLSAMLVLLLPARASSLPLLARRSAYRNNP